MAFGAQLATSYSKPYWDGLSQAKIRLQRCADCGRCQNFPQARCRHCLSERLEWIDAAGTGTLITFSTVYRAPSPEFAVDVPYIVGMVQLPEAVQLMALIAVADEKELELDMPLVATPRRFHGEGYVLAFTPAKSVRGGQPLGTGN